MVAVRASGVVVVAVVVLAAAVGVQARPGSKGIKPLMGWNTWCTQNKCGVDWCTSDEVLDVAKTIKASGMLAAGYDHINLDDCWGLRDPKTHEIKGDPVRFPEGMKAFIKKIHDLGFKFGLYTDLGADACHSPFTGSYPYYAQDAATFKDWEVDYVKFDDCNLPDGHTKEELSCDMSSELLKTGRDFWLCFHCDWNSDTCAKCGTSFRIAHDHHDEWDSTSSIIDVLAHNRQPYWGPNPTYGLPDPDFIFTGGQGCGAHSPPGTRCPGQTEDEYMSEFSVWTIAGGSLLIASDPRNMTDFMARVWFNHEILAVYNDSASLQSVRAIGNGTLSHARHTMHLHAQRKQEQEQQQQRQRHDLKPLASCALEKQLSHDPCVQGVSFGCNGDETMWTDHGCRGIFTCDGVQDVTCNEDGSGKHTCKCVTTPPPPSIVLARPLSDNSTVAVVIHNAAMVNQTLGFHFSAVPERAWNSKTTLHVRDLWRHADLGKATGSFSTFVPAHGSAFLLLSPAS
ncbi:hypothetical protein PTSG_02230 [Salpingoeca rosetta]|uniref:Alpha-galactosidase n=1 Tax=Salpingoeca rosetta (strain ATCC 50818 / BSB-021) TaxID=946362 RepID=F2U1L0_SALR5|nr:uncharacterized protein PTSG_02230 [Salpingoeca rosetta]EGD81512.1 hypothetical protein PTSG_02230 [Salpingoeca rosetta]|eukprot:XP_004996716.1 hypothetical protein PTSG_02230 [Salpingoeca rosetta]